VIGALLQTTSEKMLAYARVAAMGAQLSGQIGAQGHFANGLAALYIATGQDAACVAESAVGFTRMEPREGGLYMAVTLPNLMVGTVGGGTGLPTQRAALEMMGLYGTGKAGALAEVAASLCLAGEISIMAAIAAGHFTRAHERLARARK
jgi:hydroxymethylglutaryl-CoA reductase (NADPH)